MQAKNLVVLQEQIITSTRSENLTLKFRGKISVQLLPTYLDGYFSKFEQCIKKHPQTSTAYDLQWLQSIFWCSIRKNTSKKNIH